jgi:ribosomal subunit interface protein
MCLEFRHFFGELSGREIGAFDTIETRRKPGVPMEIRIEYQGLKGSPWMREYLEGKLARLERYLSTGARIDIDLIAEGDQCRTHFSIRTLHHEYEFEKEGCDIYEAFTQALEEAAIILRREHLKIRDKFQRQFIDPTEP